MAAMKRLLSWLLAASLMLTGILHAGALPAEETAAGEGTGEKSGASDTVISSDSPLFSAYLAAHADAARWRWMCSSPLPMKGKRRPGPKP